MLQDANAILEGFLFPMSFPYAHNVVPVVKNIPRDIDEMLAIQTIEDADHEVCNLANQNFDLGFLHKETEKSRKGRQRKSAVARRGDNPGVIELITTSSQPNIEHGSQDSPFFDYEDVDTNKKGDLSLKVFEQIQASKRQKLQVGLSRRKTMHVSVKVGCSSTRPSLFSKTKAGFPLLLPAFVDPQATSKHKRGMFLLGRNDTVWSEKHETMTAQKVKFTSRLTQEKIEGGMQKRAREVVVGIRVNGKLLRSEDADAEYVSKITISRTQDLNSGNSKRKRSPEDKLILVHDTETIEQAVDDVLLVPSETQQQQEQQVLRATPQCSLNTDEFVDGILAESQTKKHYDPFGWTVKSTSDQISPLLKAPRIDCLPSEDGMIRTICTETGKMERSSVSKILDTTGCKKRSLCTVCWSEKSISGEEEVQECKRCGLVVHLRCCITQQKPDQGDFLCNLCCESVAVKGLKTPSSNGTKSQDSTNMNGTSSTMEPMPISCYCCPHWGGSMSKVDHNGQPAWVHDVCRRWGDSFVGGGGSCALCGKSMPNGTGLVKCAASGCSLQVHPMCALLLSKLEKVKFEKQNQNDGETSKTGSVPSRASNGSRARNMTSSKTETSLEQLREKDRYLCRQFTLSYTKCYITADPSPSAKDQASSSKEYILPVCFCGIHNPKRDRSLYGLYPGGYHVDESVMRVPPRDP